MTQVLLEVEAGASVQARPMILILVLSVQAGQEEEGRCEPVGLEPPLTAQMSPVFETEETASVGVLQEQDVVEDSIVQKGRVVVEGSLERRVARLRESLARHLTDEVAANETVHSEHSVVEVVVRVH
jgi:hypothetical protein